MSIVTLYPARIVERQGRQWWLCPVCAKTLAEVIGDRIVIRVHERVIGMARAKTPDQVCPQCGTHSVLDEVA